MLIRMQSGADWLIRTCLKDTFDIVGQQRLKMRLKGPREAVSEYGRMVARHYRKLADTKRKRNAS